MPFHGDDPLDLVFSGDGKHWVVSRPLHWVDPEQHWTVEVPVGFTTDLASIPRPLWPLLPAHGRYAPAAVVHDWLYWAQVITLGPWDLPIDRAYADRALRLASEDLGVSRPVRWALWSGVRAGGHRRWARYRTARAAGLPKPQA